MKAKHSAKNVKIQTGLHLLEYRGHHVKLREKLTNQWAFSFGAPGSEFEAGYYETMGLAKKAAMKEIDKRLSTPAPSNKLTNAELGILQTALTRVKSAMKRDHSEKDENSFMAYHDAGDFTWCMDKNDFDLFQSAFKKFIIS